jgi:hypothetical protein
MTQQEIQQLARNKAKQSICRCKIAAIGLNLKGEVVARTTNKPGYKSAPGRGLHAEAQLLRISKKKGIKTIFICRINRTGNFLPIRPCKNCKRYADKLNVKIIY